MQNMTKLSVAAAILTTAACTLASPIASAGVVSVPDQQVVAPPSTIETVYSRPYWRRHFRHWGYYRTYDAPVVYGYGYPYVYGYSYGYYGYANPVGAAVSLAASPFWGWW